MFTIKIGDKCVGVYETERAGWNFLSGQGWEMQHISGIWRPKDGSPGAAVVVPLLPESEFSAAVAKAA